MKLLADLIIEADGQYNVVPQGTNIQPVAPTAPAVGGIAPEPTAKQPEPWDYFQKNLKITSKQLEEKTDQVEGDRTDVDDWDMHTIEIVTGVITAASFIPKTQEILNDLAEYEGATNEERIVECLMMEDNVGSGYLIKSCVLRSLLLDLAGENLDDKVIDNDNLRVVPTDAGDKYVIDITYNVSCSDNISADNRSYRGKYRTGGRYPDA